MSEEKKNENKSVHDICHSLNEGMPEPSGLVSKFEEHLEKYAATDVHELISNLMEISNDGEEK
ncbi:MAG: hypothetical protein K5675_08080 [Lachnospiraceae bacterium]|nr:hypothetical protein [Lachnospiraceae bacterium]